MLRKLLAASLCLCTLAGLPAHAGIDHRVKHVLLISVDGLHALDLATGEGWETAADEELARADGGRQGIDVFSFGSAYLNSATHPFTVVGNPAAKDFKIENLAPLPALEGIVARLDVPPVS